MSLSGKTAVVTGSTSGIGLGIARSLAGAGADVVLNSFTNSEADHALAQEVEWQLCKCRYLFLNFNSVHAHSPLIFMRRLGHLNYACQPFEQ